MKLFFRHIFILLLMMNLSSCLFTNRMDKNKLRHGVFKTKWHTGKPMIKSRYKHGEPHGKWITRDENGKIIKIEYYYKGELKTKYYHKNGALECEGMAYEYQEKDNFRYTWEGIWHYYNLEGKYIHSIHYKKGEAIDTLKIKR